MKYIWKDGHWRDPKTDELMQTSGNGICTPIIWSDLPAYHSVVSNKMIDGRRARREDLKRTNCREVDSSEGPKFCTTEKWARRLKMEHNPDGGRPKHRPKDWSNTRIEG